MARAAFIGLNIFIAIFAGILQFASPSVAQKNAGDNSFYFVANTRPPDAYVALRTHPTSSFGQRITTMPNPHHKPSNRRSDCGPLPGLCLSKRAASLQPAARDEILYRSPITSDSDDSDDSDDADSKSYLAARSP